MPDFETMASSGAGVLVTLDAREVVASQFPSVSSEWFERISTICINKINNDYYKPQVI